MNIELKHLRIILAIHESGSVQKATEQLNMTQSAVSHQLRYIKDQLGVDIFIPETRPLKLSAEVEPSRSPVMLSSANMQRRSVEGEARVGRSAESSPSQIKPCEPEGAKLVPVRTRRAMFGEVSMSGP